MHEKVRNVTLVTHDESTFFQNDLNRSHWAHKGDKPTPQPKGDGQAIMVSDFLTADWGRLQCGEGDSKESVISLRSFCYGLTALFEQRSQNPFQAWCELRWLF